MHCERLQQTQSQNFDGIEMEALELALFGRRKDSRGQHDGHWLQLSRSKDTYKVRLLLDAELFLKRRILLRWSEQQKSIGVIGSTAQSSVD